MTFSESATIVSDVLHSILSSAEAIRNIVTHLHKFMNITYTVLFFFSYAGLGLMHDDQL